MRKKGIKKRERVKRIRDKRIHQKNTRKESNAIKKENLVMIIELNGNCMSSVRCHECYLHKICHGRGSMMDDMERYEKALELYQTIYSLSDLVGELL